MGRDVPIYALQAPFLRAGARFDEDIAASVDAYIDAMRSVQRVGPYRLLGWSIGGVIAHRIATRLEQLGETVELLVLLDSHPCPQPQAEPPADAQLLRRFLEIIGWQADGETARTASPLDTLSRIHARHARVSTLTLPQAHRLFYVFKHVLHMWRNPHLGRVAGTTVFFEATLGDARPVPLHRLWAPHVESSMTVHEIACGHDDMARPACLASIGRLLKEML